MPRCNQASLRHRKGPGAGIRHCGGSGGAGQPSGRAVRGFPGFVAFAKANPGKLNYASAGDGTLPHVTMELLLQRVGTKVTHVPYRGAAPAMTDLLAGDVQLKMDTFATSIRRSLPGAAHARQCEPPPLAVMPDVPTVAEMGLPGYEGNLWIGMMAPPERRRRSSPSSRPRPPRRPTRPK